MKELFVPYEIALKLKEKGFNEPCFGLYNSFGQFTGYNSDYSSHKNSDQLYDDVWLQDIKQFGHTADMLCTAPLWQQAIDWCLHKLEENNPEPYNRRWRYEISSDYSGCWDFGFGDFYLEFKDKADSILKILEKIK